MRPLLRAASTALASTTHAALALLLISSTTHAESWQSVAKTSSESEYFIDRDSITGPPTARSFIARRNAPNTTGAPQSFRYSYVIDCDGREFKLLAGEAFAEPNLGGARITGGQFNNLNVAQPIKAGAVSERYLATVCDASRAPTAANPAPPPQAAAATSPQASAAAPREQPVAAPARGDHYIRVLKDESRGIADDARRSIALSRTVTGREISVRRTPGGFGVFIGPYLTQAEATNGIAALGPSGYATYAQVVVEPPAQAPGQNAGGGSPPGRARDLPVVTAVDVGGNDVVYRIPMTFYNLRLLSGEQSCRFKYKVGDRDAAPVQLRPPFEFEFAERKTTLNDVRIAWDNTVGIFSVGSCEVTGDIHLSEIHASLWKQAEQSLDAIHPDGAQCLKHGMSFKRLPYFTHKRDDVVQYPSTLHPVAVEVISACREILGTKLRKGYDCRLEQSSRASRCDDEWVESRGNQHFRLAGLKSVIEAKLAGKTIVALGFETAQADAEHRARVAQQEQERKRRADEDEKHRRWLETDEGRKHLADEAAKAKKAQEQRLKEEAAEKARMAQEFPFYAELSCTLHGSPVGIISCMTDNSGGTTLELRNGTHYKMYQFVEVHNAFPRVNGRHVIDLRKNFALEIQNAGKNMILGVKVVHRASGDTVYEKQVSWYGTISVKH